jgi:putative SOS response-associated peptidase YedK
MRWGLVPSWAPDPSVGSRMINARSETIDERSAFREAFERRRCLIIADGYYEWRNLAGMKVPMRIRLRDDQVFAFAGVWEKWLGRDGRSLITCSILTTSPSPSIAFVHDRMPVILARDERAQWLDRHASPESLKPLLKSYADDELSAYVVSPLVNHVDNDGPQCVVEAAAPSASEQTSLF